MAPRVPKKVVQKAPIITSDEASQSDTSEAQVLEEEFHTEDESDISEADVAPNNLVPGGVEYHTDESSDEDEDPRQSAPYLPAHLLQPLPSPAHSGAQQAVSIPWEQMTSQQKKAQRSRSRQGKKRVYDRLRRDARGSGVLEAGVAAQVKRGVVGSKSKDRVKSGRVGKKSTSKARVSGRQQVLEQRKRVVGGNEVARPAKKAKTGRKG